ncbi:hypothetical protein [uncultured Microbacterium sp.]|uniref:hypothetical protein n=1 Tax=uncultured Microbacterium sp. TaxID=191216 RepID=UPI0035C95D04
MKDGVADFSGERLEFALDSDVVAIVVDPDAGKEGGEELALDGPVGAGEECVRSFHEVEVAEHHVGALVELLVCGGESILELVLLDLHFAQATTKRVGGK